MNRIRTKTGCLDVVGSSGEIFSIKETAYWSTVVLFLAYSKSAKGIVRSLVYSQKLPVPELKAIH